MVDVRESASLGETLHNDLGQPFQDNETLPGEPHQDSADETHARGDAVGRFIILDLLGAGGMGEVYLAYDPKLDRRVAVKLLRPVRSMRASDARARLIREARSIARLSHPNVITVHDVAEWQGRVFLAMEFVDGPTLAAWTREYRNDVAAILAVYRAAGEGLAAAHRAGLVHRDFKPDNVLVDCEGDSPRPRVLDFGLARAAVTPDEPPPDETTMLADTARGVPNLNLTTTGMLLGTPAYMAPEQFTATKVDHRTDQFSFCVALWKALYQQPPFAGTTLATLGANVMQGQLRLPKRDTKVPPWVLAALRRGLSATPDDRFPDMPSLLAALTPNERRPRRWVFATAVAIAVTALVAAMFATPREHPVIACTGDAALLAGTWDHDRQQAAAASFAELGSSAAWTQVVRLVDTWHERWFAGRARACADTHHHHRQSLPALELRLACLDRQRDELAARVDLWTHADAAIVERAVQSASDLPRPETCDHAGTQTPAIPASEAAKVVQAKISRVRAQTAAGKYDAAISLAQDLATQPVDHPPTTAELHLALGRALEAGGQPQPAREALHTAVRHALTSGDDLLALAAATSLAATTGIRLSHYDEGEGWLHIAEALAERLPVGREHTRLGRVSCNFLNDRGQRPAARPHCERALQLAETLDGRDSLEAAASLLSLANNMVLDGQPQAARPLLARAWQITVELLGPLHPQLIRLANSRAAAEYLSGDRKAAIATWDQGLAIAEASVGSDHLDLALFHINLASTALEDRAWTRAAQALAALERIYLPKKGADAAEQTVLHHVRGHLAAAEGDLAAARNHFVAQRESAIATRAPDHPDVLLAELNLGDVHARLGDLAASQHHHSEALTRAEQLQDDHSVALALRGLCRARVGLGRAAEALTDCERAIPLAAKIPHADPLRADLKAWLAQARLATTTADPTARTFLDEAQQQLANLGEAGQELLALHPNIAAAN